MDMERQPESQSRQEPVDLELDNMRERELEQVLVSLLVVKYPGVERADIARFFQALDAGDIDRVGQAEADIAYKSAQWKLAVLDMDSDA